MHVGRSYLRHDLQSFRASDLHATYQASAPHSRRGIIQKLFPRIDLAPAKLILRLDADNLVEQLVGTSSRSDPDDRLQFIVIERPISLRRRGKETRIVLADNAQRAAAPDENMIRMLRKAHFYLAQLTDGSGRSISEVATANEMDRSDFSRVLRLAFLAPKITDQILSFAQPPELTAQTILRLRELPHSWTEQYELLGA